MHKVLICLVSLLLLSGLMVAQSEKAEDEGHAAAARSSEHGSDAANVKNAVKKMENEMRQSVMKGDASAAEKYLADDYHAISGANGQASTKQQTIDRLKSGATKYSQINVADEDVALFGNDVAIDHGEADVKLTMDGKDVSGKYHFSRTWLKRNGKWQAVWFQATKME